MPPSSPKCLHTSVIDLPLFPSGCWPGYHVPLLSPFPSGFTACPPLLTERVNVCSRPGSSSDATAAATAPPPTPPSTTAPRARPVHRPREHGRRRAALLGGLGYSSAAQRCTDSRQPARTRAAPTASPTAWRWVMRTTTTRGADGIGDAGLRDGEQSGRSVSSLSTLPAEGTKRSLMKYKWESKRRYNHPPKRPHRIH